MATNQVHSVATGPSQAAVSASIPAATDDDLALLTLDDEGILCDCSSEGEALFKYCRDELIGRHISLLLPELLELELMQDGQINPHLRVRCRFGCHFVAVTRDGEHFPSDLFLTDLGRSGRNRVSVIVRRGE